MKRKNNSVPIKRRYKLKIPKTIQQNLHIKNPPTTRQINSKKRRIHVKPESKIKADIKPLFMGQSS